MLTESWNTIDLSLNIHERITISHDDDIESLLFFMNYNCESMTIVRINTPLIKEIDAVHYENKSAIMHRLNDLTLQR